jgi:predicted AlkP superfamily pyrophosphatase or phosphodiesterase
LSDSKIESTVLMIFLDAFSKAYLSKEFTPFLHNLASEGISTTVKPIFAFRGIETTMFTGVWPSVHGSWTEFKLADDFRRTGKIRVLQWVIKILDTIPSDGLRAKSRFFVERYIFKIMYKTPNLMPPETISYFESTQLKETFESCSLNETATIFDVFRKKAISYVFIEPWIRGDKEVFSKAKKMIRKKGRHRFWYIKFSHLDHLGHRFGPEPSIFKDELLKIDSYVKDIVNLAKTKRDHLSVLIIADHGMSRVNSKVNIAERLSRLNSQMYRDYLVFVDSTLIRFWFFNETAMHEVSGVLDDLKCGHTLSAEEKKSLHIPVDPKYGELVFVLDEGFVNHPSFFNQKSEVKGMHGYAYSKTPESCPILIMNGIKTGDKPTKNDISYVDISHLILRSLFPGANHANDGLSGYLK